MDTTEIRFWGFIQKKCRLQVALELCCRNSYLWVSVEIFSFFSPLFFHLLKTSFSTEELFSFSPLMFASVFFCICYCAAASRDNYTARISADVVRIWVRIYSCYILSKCFTLSFCISQKDLKIVYYYLVCAPLLYVRIKQSDWISSLSRPSFLLVG